MIIYLLIAIAYCYKHEIWYHDIRLENIFLMSDEIQDLVIGDFGYPIEIINDYHDDYFGSIKYIALEIWEESPFIEKGYLVIWNDVI
jgi:hypothetical protein